MKRNHDSAVVTGVCCAFILGIATSDIVAAWPYDGYAETGIRRLEEIRLIMAGEIKGNRPAHGARWPTSAVDIRLRQYSDMDLPPSDSVLASDLQALLGDDQDSYAIALLDISDPMQPVYAEWRGDYRQNVGSVGKIIGALGLFQALADAYPGDHDARVRALRNTRVSADVFSQRDHHKVRMFDPASRQLTRRILAVDDEASLWEYLDWMLSVSSNAAASMVMRDAMMLRAKGRDYPLSNSNIPAFFDAYDRSEKTALFKQTFWEPVSENGFDLHAMRQGSFFTAGGKQQVNGGGNSYATVRSLMELALRLEQGRLVDEWSSRQLKRLIYLTERRIRYASAPALRDAAVYFKSGSLYSCKKEPGFTCRDYAGNVRNYMNSLAIIEQDVDGKRLHYIVTLISNVLRKNSAVEHQALGGSVHHLMLERHAARSGTVDY